MNEVHGRGVHGDSLCTQRCDSGRAGVHAHEVRRDVAMSSEGREDGKSGVRLPSEAVDQDMDFLARVFGEDIVHVVCIEVVSSDVSFQVKLVLRIFSHSLDVMAQRYLSIIRVEKTVFSCQVSEICKIRDFRNDVESRF